MCAVFYFYTDYVRIVLVLTSYYVMFTRPWLACSAYFSNVLLDELDGIAARKFDQCTQFGAVLDMIIDRCVYCCVYFGWCEPGVGFPLLWSNSYAIS